MQVVFGFTDPIQALEHFKVNQSNYSLILSDFRIPLMDGVQLLKEVKSINPEVRTLLISAFGMNEDFEQCNCVDAFLQKPISIRNLIDAVETQISTSHLAT
jgi:response regulator RpfG family c-di-GMP phosphodiesterase